MKRLLPAVGVLLVALTACVASASSAPQATGARAAKTETVQAIAAARKRAARQRAGKLLHAFAPPPHATRLRSFSAAHGPLAQSGLGTPGDGELARRHGFWQVRTQLSSAVSYVKSHPVSGLQLGSQANTPGAQPSEALNFTSRTRLLTVTLVRLHQRTVIRVDAGAVWIYPRSPKEVVPAGVHTIDIHSESAAKNVTSPEEVATIIRWFNALDVVQPGVHVICPAVLVGPPATFNFRAGNGTLLAQAVVPSGYSSSCNAVMFSIGGHRQTPLLGGDFLLHVERLLGVRFGSAQRP